MSSGLPCRRAPRTSTQDILINLHAWRDEHIAERVLEYANANAAKLVAWDQDALNANLFGRWRKCRPIWNAQEAFFLRFSASELGVSEQELKEVRSDPRLVHFTGSAKPWNVYPNHPFERDNFMTLAMTPWRGSPPPRPPPSALRKLASRVVPGFIKQGYRRLRAPLRAPEAARGD